MIYQLPNGKVIKITLEEFLSLSDEELAFLESHDYGESVTSPWVGSVISSKIKSIELDDVTFLNEADDIAFEMPPDIDDDILEFPDDMITE